MFMDSTLEFADASSIGTPNNSTVNVGSTVDSDLARDIGAGQPVYLVITVDTAVTSGGSATVRFKMVSDGTSTIATDGTATEHMTTHDFPVASLVAGYTVVIPLTSVNPSYERYLGFQAQETASSALTAGAINAFLTIDPHGWQSYPDNVK